MDKPNWSQKIIEILFTVLITSFISLGITLLVDNISCTVNIGTSISSQDTYLTPFTISNTDKKGAIKEIELSVGDFNIIKSVNSNYKYKINEDNILVLNYIPPDETISIILETKNIVKEDNVRISYNGNVNMKYLKNNSNIYNSIIIQAVIYFLVLIISQKLFDIKSMQQKKLIDNISIKADEVTEELEKAKREQEKTNEDIKIVKNDNYKIKLYYLARMKDYSKELEFWKDTIRKFIYQSSNNKDYDKNVENLLEIVTDSLKTYGTRSKLDLNYNEIDYLAKVMNDTK